MTNKKVQKKKSYDEEITEIIKDVGKALKKENDERDKTQRISEYQEPVKKERRREK